MMWSMAVIRLHMASTCTTIILWVLQSTEVISTLQIMVAYQKYSFTVYLHPITPPS